MKRYFSRGPALVAALAIVFISGWHDLRAAEKRFSFSDVVENQTPPGFRSAVSGVGPLGVWKVIQAEVAPIPGSGSESGGPVQKSVLAQLSTDPTDERFPMLIYEDEVFSDFRLTTKFKTMEGKVEQMAGIAFRVQNETNYYVIRASSLGNTFRFYKVRNGLRSEPIGPSIQIPAGVWHELTVECKGTQIRSLLDGREVIPALNDSTFSKGKFAFWTKSDSVSYFADTRITYIPQELPAKRLVREVTGQYDRVLDLQIFIASTNASNGTTEIKLLSRKEGSREAVGDGNTEAKVMNSGRTYYGKTKSNVSVVMPLRDRNGEVIAAVRVIMESFKGQTEENAVVRAAPVVKRLQASVRSLEDLVEP